MQNNAPAQDQKEKAAPVVLQKIAPKKFTPAPDPTEGKPGKFEIKRAKDGRFVFNLYASNKTIIATSQAYSSATNAITGINSVINNAAQAPIEDQTKAKYESLSFPKWEVYRDKGGEFRFRLNAANGSCVCHSQGYTTKASCMNGINSVIRSSKNAPIEKAYLED